MTDERRIVFSRHADDMIIERAIERDWVYQTIRDPETVEADPYRSDIKRAFRRIPAQGNRILRVAYVETADEIRIVTLFFDRAKRN